MDILLNEHYNTMWQALSSVMAIIATIMATFALVYSVRTYKRTMQVVHYGEIDRMYFDILKEAMAKPYFAKSDIPKDELQQQEYEIYAFIMWNFLEAIYDRCERDRDLQKTWYPILELESDAHKPWLDKDGNRKKFKNEFLLFIDDRKFS